MLTTRGRRLRDLDRWQASGWLTPDGHAALKSEIEASRSGIGLAHVLATLAAVLIGFSAMSFVAANWQEMSKLARLIVIFGALWSFHGLAGWLKTTASPKLAEAASLAAVAMYGAGIMLIAQMYHMDGHPPDAVLLWGAGAVVSGFLLRSNQVFASALLLFCFWSLMEMDTQRGIHWPFLLAWASVAAGYAWTRWKPGLQLLSLTLSGWIVTQPYQFGFGQGATGHSIVVLIGVCLMGASIAAGPAIDRWRQISGAMLIYGFLIAYAGLFALQFVTDRHGDLTLLLGMLTIAGIVGALMWAWRTDNRGALWVAYCVFSLEIFSLYIKKIGSLIGTSLFFLVTGLLVAGLAWAAFKLHSGSQSRAGVAS